MPESAAKFRILKRCASALCWLVLGVLVAGTAGWAALAIAYTNLHCEAPRWTLAAVFIAACAAALFWLRPRRWRLDAYILLFAAVVAWFFSAAPSNDRDWAADVAMPPSAHIDGDRVTIRNVRNFQYRSETDFDPKWEERVYDLGQLKSVDLMLVYWGSKAIAHVMFSYGFEDGRYLTFSIEARREKCESYSSVEGFFRQYELVYVVADERDVIRLRTDFRREDVYLFHVRAKPEAVRESFLSYLDALNRLQAQPQWYNALTDNCATSTLPHIRAAGGKGELSLDILLSGYADRVAYRNGRIDDSMPLEELERRSYINPAAVAAGDDADFSAKIRAGLPVPAPALAPVPAP